MTSRQRQKILILLSLWQAGGTEAWRFCFKNLGVEDEETSTQELLEDIYTGTPELGNPIQV